MLILEQEGAIPEFPTTRRIPGIPGRLLVQPLARRPLPGRCSSYAPRQDGPSEVHVVRGHQHRLRHRLDKPYELSPCSRVQPCRGLVGHDDLRPHRQHGGDCRPSSKPPWEKRAISTCHFAAKNPSVSLMDPRSALAMTPREQVGREAVPRN